MAHTLVEFKEEEKIKISISKYANNIGTSLFKSMRRAQNLDAHVLNQLGLSKDSSPLGSSFFLFVKDTSRETTHSDGQHVFQLPAARGTDCRGSRISGVCLQRETIHSSCQQVIFPNLLKQLLKVCSLSRLSLHRK